MVKVKEDLTGKQFGRLTVICQTEDHIKPNGQHVSQWLCECGCDEHNIITVWGENLTKKRNPTRSCGCLRKEKASETGYKNKKYNRYDLSGEYGIGWTSNTNKEFYFDLEDYDKIKNRCWIESKSGTTSRIYGKDPTTKKPIFMHILLGYKNYDHIDRNELNNCKNNFRECNHQENMRNSSKSKNNKSGFIGVSWNKSKNKWRAYIAINYKTIHLGLFINKDDAIRARLRAEKEYFKEFAPQRHLFEEYGIVDGGVDIDDPV